MKVLNILFLMMLSCLGFNQATTPVTRGTIQAAGSPYFASVRMPICDQWSIVSTNGWRYSSSLTGTAVNETDNHENVAPADIYVISPVYSPRIRDTGITNGLGAAQSFWGEMPSPNPFYVQSYLVRFTQLALGGTATGSTSTTLVDSSKTFTSYGYLYWVHIIGGKGAGQYRQVANGSSGTSLAISVAWTINPDATSTYEINAASVTPFTFGGKGRGVCDYYKLQADPLFVHIPKGERYLIRTVASLPTVAAPSAPTVTAVAGSGFNGSYYVCVTYHFPDGMESVSSAASTIVTTTGAQSLQVAAVSNPNNGSDGYLIYITPVGWGNSSYFILSFAGVQPYTGAAVTLSDNITTAQFGRKWCKPGSKSLPLGSSCYGNSWSSGGLYTGTGEWRNLNGDYGAGYNQSPSFFTGSFGPLMVLGRCSMLLPSGACFGDSVHDGVGDGGWGAGKGGALQRFLGLNSGSLTYDTTRTPMAGFVPLASPGETAQQFANPQYSTFRMDLSGYSTYGYCNYSINDLGSMGEATLAQNLCHICVQYLNASLTDTQTPTREWIQDTIQPKVTTGSDGYTTVTNQATAAGGASIELHRRAHNNWIRNASGSIPITNEALGASLAAAVTPATNLFAGGDATTTTFIPANAFVAGSETVKVAGVTKVLTTDYSYGWIGYINGVTYASDIIFVTAPANAASVTMSYTTMPGFVSLIKILTGAPYVYVCDIAKPVEVNGAGVQTLNGGWWKPNGTAVSTGTVLSATATSLTVSGTPWTTDQWRGYQVWITSGTGAGGLMTVITNTSSTLTTAGSWYPAGTPVTPTSGAGYAIGLGYTYSDGVHPSPTAYNLWANLFQPNWILVH